MGLQLSKQVKESLHFDSCFAQIHALLSHLVNFLELEWSKISLGENNQSHLGKLFDHLIGFCTFHSSMIYFQKRSKH